jgi:uncharacterized surface protein with fasciclin (FAS1) repeats
MNAAFMTFNTEATSLGTGGTLTAANLTKVLNYHVASGNVLRAGLTNSLVINTLQNMPMQQNVTVQFTASTLAIPAVPATATTPFVPAVAATTATYRLVSANPVTPARTSTITTFDIQGTNGVIHLIDRVLLPL